MKNLFTSQVKFYCWFIYACYFILKFFYIWSSFLLLNDILITWEQRCCIFHHKKEHIFPSTYKTTKYIIIRVNSNFSDIIKYLIEISYWYVQCSVSAYKQLTSFVVKTLTYEWKTYTYLDFILHLNFQKRKTY